ncbi:hypothetical protein [Mucilaginibacter myungsuensis]|uniref:Uncharacterized protein n=1 Tax=Mucilaginibacter myungsuensis TaxID=649104 RepID=A0A929KSJ2_9SPHI|nr:hypothetical protein [Mucilaginibacter myungsuensis]MBE9660729.1 hypothetical protein [Mucilaginibacter myungsuensis]MDN3600774.1 hypothetical protein [Mucilaginibacter myungsuensis]
MSKEEDQNRHEQLIDFLNEFNLYNGALKKVDKKLTSNQFQSIKTNNINQAVKVLTDVLNLSGGSVSDVDFYELLQAYFQVPSYREKFNTLVKEAKYH